MSKKGKSKLFDLTLQKLFYISLVVLLVVFIFFIFRSNVFKVKSVGVQSFNVKCTDDKQIKNSSNLLGQNIFFVRKSNIENNLKKDFICVKSVNLVKTLPDRVKLEVFGREAVAILVSTNQATNEEVLENFIATSSASEATPSGETFVVDNEGIIYSKDAIDEPKIYLYGKSLHLGERIEEGVIKNILKVFEKLKIFGVDIKEAKLYQENILLVNASTKIIFKLDEVDIQLASLQLILNQAKIDEDNLEFIDLRFDKPVVRIAPKKKNGQR